MIESLEQRRNIFIQESKDWSPEAIHELFLNTAKKYPDNKYIVCNERVWTYKECQEDSNSLAGALIELGMKKEENIALILPNYAEFILSKLAISLARGIAVPLNYRLRNNEFEYLINQSESSYIITLDQWDEINYIDMLKKLSPELFRDEKSTVFPHLKKIIVYSPEGKKYDGTIDFYDLIQSSSSIDINKYNEQLGNLDVHDVSDIMYTSGTTSLPKGVLVTHDMIWRSAIGSCLNRGFQRGRKVFIPIPFYHTFAFIEG